MIKHAHDEDRRLKQELEELSDADLLRLIERENAYIARFAGICSEGVRHAHNIRDIGRKLAVKRKLISE